MHPRIEHLLITRGVRHTVRRHADLPVPIRSPKDFAAAIGYPLSRITKTLFLRGDAPGSYALATCSVDRKANLRLVAEMLGNRKLELASPAELDRTLGYPPTGVSPIAADSVPVVLDQDLFAFSTVLVGGGRVGVEIEISPTDLERITAAKRLAFSTQPTTV